MAAVNPMKSYKRYKGGRPQSAGRRVLTALLVLILIGALTFCALLGAVVAGGHDEIRGEPQVMLILGCQVKPWGPSILLQDRLDEALDYLEEHPDLVIVVSGGQGGDEPSTEAAAMAEYLTAHGVSEESLLLEERSTNTWENLCYSLELLTEQGYDVDSGVILVSNGFHLARARMLWQRLTGEGDSLSTLAAPSSHVPSRLSMYIREPLALAKSFLLDR